jgi:Holliday junction resolvase RusA-like endonuclease
MSAVDRGPFVSGQRAAYSVTSLRGVVMTLPLTEAGAVNDALTPSKDAHDADFQPPAVRRRHSPLVVHAYGTPIPQGSHKAFVVGKKGGPQRAIVTDDNQRTKPWKQTVKHAALEAIDAAAWPMTERPVAVQVMFRLPRPKGHYGSGRNAHIVKASSPDYPAVKPDGDKLVRALLDALGEAGVWRDDAQVIEIYAIKVYADHDVPGARIDVRVIGR